MKIIWMFASEGVKITVVYSVIIISVNYLLEFAISLCKDNKKWIEIGLAQRFLYPLSLYWIVAVQSEEVLSVSCLMFIF